MTTTVKVLYYPVIVGCSEGIFGTYSTNIQVVCHDEGSVDYGWIMEGISEAPSDQLAIWTSSQQEFDELVLAMILLMAALLSQLTEKIQWRLKSLFSPLMEAAIF